MTWTKDESVRKWAVLTDRCYVLVKTSGVRALIMINRDLRQKLLKLG